MHEHSPVEERLPWLQPGALILVDGTERHLADEVDRSVPGMVRFYSLTTGEWIGLALD